MDLPSRVKTEISCLNDHLQLHGIVAHKACKGEFFLETSESMGGAKDHSWEGIAVFSIFTISALQNSTSASQTSTYGLPYNFLDILGHLGVGIGDHFDGGCYSFRWREASMGILRISGGSIWP